MCVAATPGAMPETMHVSASLAEPSFYHAPELYAHFVLLPNHKEKVSKGHCVLL